MEPKLYQFEFLENPRTKFSVQIIASTQADWQRLSDEFRLPSYTVSALLAMANYTPVKACREVYDRWLNGGNELLTPKSWDTVIKVMERIGNARLGEDIRKALGQ